MNTYKRVGNWHEAVGSYSKGSEEMPSWKVWIIAGVAVAVFFGIVPAVGYLVGF